tara:strand:+ start:2210 stop:3601 length:1392 start_codon:yes stop_codon:yes gene_type:complete
MSLFSLGDIRINKGDDIRKGPLAPLTESKYNNKNYRFPLDIGNSDKGHYMTFYIRQQDKTSFGGGAGGPSELASDNFNTAAQQASALAGGGSVTSKIQKGISAAKGSLGVDANFSSGIGGKIQAGINQVGSAVGAISSKINEVGGNIQSGLNNVFGQKSLPIGGDSAKTRSIISTNVKKISEGDLKFLKTTKRTVSAITLYMPDTLLFNFTQSYDQLNIGNSIPGQLLAAGANNLDAIKQGFQSAKNLDMGGVADAAKSIDLKGGAQQVGQFAFAKGLQAAGGGAGELAFLKATGNVINPMLEMIYRSPNFRSFQFDFTFYPRDEREALEVQKILKQFQFHQAPEKSKVAGFLVPPSQFDIEFMYAGKQNPNIPAIAPACILTTIDINYAPQGASFYEVPGEVSPTLGGTGMPFAVNLVLQFQETVYLTKTDLELEDGAKGSESNKLTSTGVLKQNKAQSGGL